MNKGDWDIVYAGAGILLGIVTFYRLMRALRYEHIASQHCAVPLGSLGRTEIPLQLFIAAMLSLGCSIYLFFKLCS